MGKKQNKESAFTPARIFGVLDTQEKVLVLVSLEETVIDLDMVFRDTARFFKCEFTINPVVATE
jgi:hypothetical protein